MTKRRDCFANPVFGAMGLLVALGLLLAGCGSGQDENPKPTSQPGAEKGAGGGGTPTATTQPAGPDTDGDGGAAAPTASGLEELKITLPNPLFIGTPKNISVPNLQKADAKPPVIMVPPGTKNVALGKPVTSDETDPFPGELKQITDGDKEGTDGSYVELGTGPQWVQIDLGAEYEIYAVALWHFHQEGRVYYDVVVQVSDNPDFITGVQTIFNNDDDNSAGQGAGTDQNYVDEHKGKLIDAKKVKGRYVRLYSNGNTSNDSNHYIEVEVYGTPVK